MPRKIKVKMTNVAIKGLYRLLVDREGIDNELFTFDLCTMYGLELADSTIDKIVVKDSDVLFYYNANENDFDYIEHFKLPDLTEFYNDLRESIEEEKEYMYAENYAEGAVARLG